MTQYEIRPFELTPEFEECWRSAGSHLSLRVRDAGASWLRADLPPFREHFSFALGNQLFFVQIKDVDHPANGWVQDGCLQAIVKEANGIGCLMPMRKIDGDWKAVERGWGLIEFRSKQPISPFDLATDEPIEMTAWEIHDVGIQAVRHHLSATGWTIASWQSDLNVDPSLFAGKDGQFCGFVVRTSEVGVEAGNRPNNAGRIAEQLRARGWGAKFVGMKITADFQSNTDPRLEHLTRRLLRRSLLLLSPILIEELVPHARP
jgi:hypothetical protein